MRPPQFWLFRTPTLNTRDRSSAHGTRNGARAALAGSAPASASGTSAASRPSTSRASVS
jgi:hypothetical protein